MNGRRRRHAAPTPGSVPLAVSAGVAGPVNGPPREVRVLAAFPRAVYLEHPDGVLALLSSDAVHPPNGLVLPRPAAHRPLAGCHAGLGGKLGGGRLVLADLVAHVSRWWRPRPTLRSVTPATLARNLAKARTHLADAAPAAEPALAAPAVRLVDGLAAADRPGALATAAALLGRGPGLTPAGDDVLAGVLAAAQLLPPAVAAGAEADRLVAVSRDVAAVVAERAQRATNPISAALLHHAARGEVAAPAAILLRALTGHGDLTTALDRVLAIGATSGRDLALGILVGAELPSLAAGPADPLLDGPGADRPSLRRVQQRSAR